MPEATLNLFPARIRFVNADGTLSPEAYRALQSLSYRVGGVVAPTIPDLDVQQYADAGIEETKAQLNALQNDLAMLPPAVQCVIEALTSEVSELRAQLAVLTTQLNDLQQGVEL